MKIFYFDLQGCPLKMFYNFFFFFFKFSEQIIFPNFPTAIISMAPIVESKSYFSKFQNYSPQCRGAMAKEKKLEKPVGLLHFKIGMPSIFFRNRIASNLLCNVYFPSWTILATFCQFWHHFSATVWICRAPFPSGARIKMANMTCRVHKFNFEQPRRRQRIKNFGTLTHWFKIQF